MDKVTFKVVLQDSITGQQKTFLQSVYADKEYSAWCLIAKSVLDDIAGTDWTLFQLIYMWSE